jgi:hypothetical protein
MALCSLGLSPFFFFFSILGLAPGLVRIFGAAEGEGVLMNKGFADFALCGIGDLLALL